MKKGSTRAVPKISSHSEYLENRSRGLWCNLAAGQWRPYCSSV